MTKVVIYLHDKLAFQDIECNLEEARAFMNDKDKDVVKSFPNKSTTLLLRPRDIYIIMETEEKKIVPGNVAPFKRPS